MVRLKKPLTSWESVRENTAQTSFREIAFATPEFRENLKRYTPGLPGGDNAKLLAVSTRPEDGREGPSLIRYTSVLSERILHLEGNVNCPNCDAVIDVDQEDLDEGDVLTCDECAATLIVTSLDPPELTVEGDGDDEDEDDVDFDDDEDEEEEEEEDEWK